jgi:isoamyl acetate esterase
MDSKSKPLFITIWFGANDATFTFVNVPIDKFVSNIRLFVTSLLEHPTVKQHDTKIILITPPPINVPPPRDPNEPIDEAKKRLGYLTWINKMKYADAVLKLEEEFVLAGLEDQVGCVDVWRALVNFGLKHEGRETIEPHVQLTEDLVVSKKPTSCGLPGSPRFPDGVFIDGLHFDELVSCL